MSAYKLLQLALAVTVASSVVHAAIMTVQSFGAGDHMGHLAGDVLALLMVAVVLSVLVVATGRNSAKTPPGP